MRVIPFATLTAVATLLVAGCGPKTPESKPGAQQAALTGDAERGKIVYTANCAGCHLPTGKGKIAGQPDFTDAAWHAKEDDEELLSVIHKGDGKMPAFEGKLTDQQIADALAYVRTFPNQTAE